MGGRKKPKLSQLDKRSKKEERKKRKEKKFEMKLDAGGGVSIESLDQILNEVKRLKYVTPYLLASKFSIKVSRAKKILRQLENEGILKYIDGNRRVRIYVPVKT